MPAPFKQRVKCVPWKQEQEHVCTLQAEGEVCAIKAGAGARLHPSSRG